MDFHTLPRLLSGMIKPSQELVNSPSPSPSPSPSSRSTQLAGGGVAKKKMGSVKHAAQS